jgi:hypothetical protein
VVVVYIMHVFSQQCRVLSALCTSSYVALWALQQTAFFGRSLEGNYISAEIPPELGNLSNLVSLNLGRNNIRGSIPDSFGHLLKLQKL